jgi:hypothetical protein
LVSKYGFVEANIKLIANRNDSYVIAKKSKI